mmetsp:Transcript_2227/g.3300  ORF Transcript_2227/g.3300 Transcript_2227/m.3300 type:complete len:303 (-) Transcript_2227:208-1116(-)
MMFARSPLVKTFSIIAIVMAVKAFQVPVTSSFGTTGKFSTRGRMLMSSAPAATATEPWALIFDCDGVILESEGLHRDAYNQVFREFDVDYVWTEEYYDVLQNKVGGGIPKMRYHFGENGWPSWKLGPAPTTEEEQNIMLNTLQDRKTNIYKEYISGGTAELRPGILRLIEEAKATPNTKLAICSASTKAAALFVLDNLLGEEVLSNFDLVMAGDDVPRRKPDPMIYEIAVEKLGVPKERCIVIEDSLIGLQAAEGAGLNCIITYTPSTKDQDFSAAKAVFPDLGSDGDKSIVTAASLYGMIE